MRRIEAKVHETLAKEVKLHASRYFERANKIKNRCARNCVSEKKVTAGEFLASVMVKQRTLSIKCLIEMKINPAGRMIGTIVE